MKQTAVNIIKAAAIAAGLPETAIMDAPDKDGITLPGKRIEMEYFPEQYHRTGKPLGKTPTAGKETTHRTLRREIHSVKLTVSAAIRSDDEEWLRGFSVDFLICLPKHTRDENGNLVKLKVEKAEYGGFTRRMVEVFKKRSKTFHITFIGRITRDTDVALIRDVNITPNYRENGNG